MWYDYNNILSRDAYLNFIIGERGVGKTYGAKKFVIKRFKKSLGEEQFVYLRRYKTELKESCGDTAKFFSAIVHEFPEDKFEVQGHNLKINGKVMGYTMALSVSNILKSTSFEKVKYIIFDEFIIDKGCYHYLPNEVETLLDLIETIARLRNIKVFFLGNAISITNPYFTYFKLSLPYNSEFKSFKNGLIVVNYIKNEEYRKVKHESDFGKLIEGTNYSKYAIDNEMLRDSKSFLGKKTQNSKHFFNFTYNNQEYGVWRDYDLQTMYICRDTDPSCLINLAITIDDHNPSTVYIKRSDYVKAIINYFRVSKLYFENQTVKNNCMEFIIQCINY